MVYCVQYSIYLSWLGITFCLKLCLEYFIINIFMSQYQLYNIQTYWVSWTDEVKHILYKMQILKVSFYAYSDPIPSHLIFVCNSSKSKSHNFHSHSYLPLTDASSREYLARSSGSLGSEEDDRLSSASEGSFSYQLTDVADVNALARLQEESQ